MLFRDNKYSHWEVEIFLFLLITMSTNELNTFGKGVISLEETFTTKGIKVNGNVKFNRPIYDGPQ